MKLIERKYLSSDSVLRALDFGRISQYFTLDVITDIAYGKAFGYLPKDEDVYGYIETVEAVGPFLNFMSVVPALQKFLSMRWIRWLIGPSVKDKHGMGKLMASVAYIPNTTPIPLSDTSQRRPASGEREIRSRQKRPQRHAGILRPPRPLPTRSRVGSPRSNVCPPAPFLSPFLPSHHQLRNKLTFPCNHRIAGSDTTATALRVTLLHIITNPRVYRLLTTEIHTALSQNLISSPIITDAEAKSLPYLQAVIREGLRIWPPVSAWLEKEVPASGDVIEGRFVPGGTKIAVAGWAMQRATNVYGADADVFRPERWLEAEPGKAREMNRMLDLIFGFGRFGCLGRAIAFVELDKVFVEVSSLPLYLIFPWMPLFGGMRRRSRREKRGLTERGYQLLRRFEFEVIHPAEPFKSVNHNLFTQRDMFLRVTRRD